MKIILPGGSGQVGRILNRYFSDLGYDVLILSRRGNETSRHLRWDGKSLGSWASEFNGADVVINLAGKSVNCRYSRTNLKEMMDSRINSTRVVGEAIAQARKPPELWIQMSTATIYAHSFEQSNDEQTGVIGGNEPDVPRYWKRSIEIAQAWEKTMFDARTPQTRKVAARSAMVMSPHSGGVFDFLSKLLKRGMGGSVAGGRQYISWIHEVDFVESMHYLTQHQNVSGPVNLSSPFPVPQGEFMSTLRRAHGVRIGLPATAWMTKIGAILMGSDAELILKSRNVVPGLLLKQGYCFGYPQWSEAARELVDRSKSLQRK